MRIAAVLVILAGCASSAPGTPIPGLPGFSQVARPDPHHCGGLAVSVQRRGSASVSRSDAPLADMLGLEFPRGLDFGPAGRARSQERFATWAESLRERALAATNVYASETTAAGAARLVQTYRHAADLLLHAELPADILTAGSPEAVTAYCGNLAAVAQPMIARAAAAATVCAERASRDGAGWWTPVCTTTVASAAP